MPEGKCLCGCGEKTKTSAYNHHGYKKGESRKFIKGHWLRGRFGEKSLGWKGGRAVTSGGYVGIFEPQHPRTNNNGYVFEHLLIAEKVLGRLLPSPAQVHHVNHKRADNRNQNLVICENQEYHFLLHVRERAIQRCGNPNFRSCKYCHQYDDPKALVGVGQNSFHQACANASYRRLYAERKNKVESVSTSGC
jgi:hypothetical protein